MIDEYNEKGWVLQDHIDSLQLPLDDVAADLEAYEADYRAPKVTAKDIVLPPFLSDQSDDRSSFAVLTPENLSEDRKSSLKIEEELPLDGIPFVQEPSKTQPIVQRKEKQVFDPSQKSSPKLSSTGSVPKSASTT